jgi:hypothetical protein
MEGVSARLSEGIKEGESQHRDMGVSVIDESDGHRRRLPRPGAITQMRVDPMIRTTGKTHVLAFFWFM